MLSEMSLEELKRWRPSKPDMTVIREMAARLVDAIHPEKVILFGSHARGNADEQSDLDFLVIAESDEPPTRRSVPLYRALSGYLVPVDILVRTPREVEASRELPFSIIQTALAEGITLYEREA